MPSLLAEMTEGKDPNELKRKVRTERVTLGAAFNSFSLLARTCRRTLCRAYTRTSKLYLKS